MATGLEPAAELHTRSVGEILDLLHQGERRAVDAVQRALPAIEKVVAALIDGWRRGGRLLYLGAGASGRIGAMDAAECPAIFGLPTDRVLAILAGASPALSHTPKAVEDDERNAMRRIDDLEVGPDDVVIGLAASGTTPFTCAGLERARERGATTVAVTCNAHSRLQQAARAPVILEVGPEIVGGSARLSAGTAQRLVCNSISTAAFVRLGQVWDRHLIYIRAESAKLQRRTEGILVALGGCSEWEAVETLVVARHELPVPVLTTRQNVARPSACSSTDTTFETVDAGAQAAIDEAQSAGRGA